MPAKYWQEWFCQRTAEKSIRGDHLRVSPYADRRGWVVQRIAHLCFHADSFQKGEFWYVCLAIAGTYQTWSFIWAAEMVKELLILLPSRFSAQLGAAILTVCVYRGKQENQCPAQDCLSLEISSNSLCKSTHLTGHITLSLPLTPKHLKTLKKKKKNTEEKRHYLLAEDLQEGSIHLFSLGKALSILYPAHPQ